MGVGIFLSSHDSLILGYMEKYIKSIEKVYTRTNSYRRVNKKLIETYLEKPEVEIRNSILLQNFWLINYLTDKIISRNDLPENLKPDILGDGAVHFLEVLDEVVRNNRPEFFSRKMYRLLQNHLLKVYVRDRESLEFSGDLDYLPGAEVNLTKELDLEDFWTDLNEIRRVVVWSRLWSRTEQRHIPSTIGIPERSWFLLIKFLEGIQNHEELGWITGLSKERVRQLIEKTIHKLRETPEIEVLRKYL